MTKCSNSTVIYFSLPHSFVRIPSPFPVSPTDFLIAPVGSRWKVWVDSARQGGHSLFSIYRYPLSLRKEDTEHTVMRGEGRKNNMHLARCKVRTLKTKAVFKKGIWISSFSGSSCPVTIKWVSFLTAPFSVIVGITVLTFNRLGI